MSARKTKTSTSVDDDVCIVCFKNITIRCIMDCEHTICYECSTRLRVLCEKLECPICRQETTIAVFSRDKGSFRSLFMRALYNEDKYKLALEDEAVRRAFAGLLAHNCPVCPQRRGFGTFKQLSDHVLREHQLMYCDLCVGHLKIFTSERKLYNRERLALHRRKGDPDNSSHRGHPLCKYCEKRYVGGQNWFLHLRRDHFYCHLCEADGEQIFYDDYSHLADHFREEHFLCEQGECLEKKFIVFRTNIDLQAHRATAHSDNKSRAQQRQDRVLTLEFSAEQGGRRRRNDRYGDARNDRREQGARAHSPPPPPPPLPPQQAPPMNTSSTQEFPTLGTGAAEGAEISGRGGSLAQRVASAVSSSGNITVERRPPDGATSGAASGGGAKGKKKKKRPAAGEGGAEAGRQNGVSTAESVEVRKATAAVNGLSVAPRPPPGLPPPGLAEPTAGSRHGGFEYQRPENFTARNGRLVLQARELIQSEQGLDAFKTLSKTYLGGGLSGEDYYASCMTLMGNDKFGKVFPELLVLLPDISKQQELLAAHEKLNKNGFQRNKFPACPTCSQVLVFADFAQHTSRHCQDGDFPALS
ncbi:E3 ubiquitin-protein ligase ZNF598-like [Pollicipes pollicipes]|uniref:E3 ubiquitin-protein ligase ZNF598-like n=1 Tax=Pollicipes pollicipes TaxID=41117 RepID=UPI0018854488|nr:E3 ubiquitin-protein ligase ZNF598-like [Pollicipes pollicipes]